MAAIGEGWGKRADDQGDDMAGIHRRVADEVFDRLHERIVTGTLGPGDRLDPTEIASSFGVSRTPVREAILRLDAQGLVERLPYRGVVVTGVDPAAAQDVAALRLPLETLAVRAAVPLLSPADLARMRELHDQLKAAVAGPEAQSAFAGLNREFHLTLYRAAGSATLIRLISDLFAHAERMRLHFDVRRGRAMDDHADILAACASDDVEAAVAATREHILGTLLMMMPEGFVITPGSMLDLAMHESQSTGAQTRSSSSR
jgi:DNA-binding GntR family transcriptional regulator